MTQRQIGFLVCALILSGCDHHRQTANQAQTEAGDAALNEDSVLTGQRDEVAQSHYPRAVLVALPPAHPTPAPKMAVSNPPIENVVPSTPAPSVEGAPPALVAPPPTDDAGRLDIHAPSPVAVTNVPPIASDQAQVQVVVLETSLGRLVIQLDDFAAPRTCDNFRKLVSGGFYNHTVFHRAIPNFMIQGGDPNSKSDDRSSYGQGGPGYTLTPEINLKHDRGAVAMARLPDTVNPQRQNNGSQFYICVAPCPSLDDQYTVFGHVIQGMAVAVRISEQPKDRRDNPLNRIEMEASLQPKEKALNEGSVINP